MIKKLFAAVLIALPLCVSAQKLGTVDSQSILTQMPEFADAQAKLDEASKKYEAEFAKLREEQDKKMAEFQSVYEDPAVPQSIKERRIQEMNELEQKVQQFAQTAQQDLQRQQQQLLQPVQAKLIEAIQKVGADNGFSLILPMEVSVYQGADVIDVTPLVKTQLKL